MISFEMICEAGVNNYIKQIIRYANRNFAENKKNIGRFLNIIRKI